MLHLCKHARYVKTKWACADCSRYIGVSRSHHHMISSYNARIHPCGHSSYVHCSHNSCVSSIGSVDNTIKLTTPHLVLERNTVACNRIMCRRIAPILKALTTRCQYDRFHNITPGVRTTDNRIKSHHVSTSRTHTRSIHNMSLPMSSKTNKKVRRSTIVPQ